MSTRAENIERIFHGAAELAGEERARFLATSCGADDALRREIEALLQLDEAADARLDRSAPEVLALDGATSLLVGRTLGPYTLRRALATGGMGTVYEAVQETPRRAVALKVLRADVASPELERRFRIEAAFLARLQHPSIAHVYEAGVTVLDGLRVPWIAMELVEGARAITIHAVESGLSLAARLELFAAACDAVHHGHQRGVIHRDLKPANILIDGEGRAKLIDFGVARAVDPEVASRRTEAGVLLGTVQYMSPEQCVDARDLDVRSDVYSLGVVLYELLCERLPYEVERVPLPQAARIVQEAPPRRPSTVLHALRGDIETILLKALEKDRARRYQTAQELADDLRRFLRREPIAAHAPSLPYRARLLARRHKALVASLAVLLLAALAAAVVSTRYAWRESAAREREELQAALANLAAADASLRAHDATTARARLEHVPERRRGWEWRHLRGRLDLSERRLEGPLGRCEGLSWRDGKIATAWQDQEKGLIVLWDAESGVELARSVVVSEALPSRVELALDGSVAWGTSDGTLGRWWPASGELRTLAKAHAGSIEAVRCDPSGRIFSASIDGSVRRFGPAGELEAVLLQGDIAWADMALDAKAGRAALAGVDGTVRVLDLVHGGEPIVLTGHERQVLAVAFSSEGERVASGSSDGTVRLWDLASRRELRRFHGHESDVSSVSFLAGGALLVSGSSDRTLCVWDVASGAQRTVLHGHEAWIGCLASEPDGARFVSGAYDGTARLWDPRAAERSGSIHAHAAIVRHLAFSPDGRYLATASFDRTARLFEASTGRDVALLGPHEAPVMSVAFHPRGHLLATACNDRKVRLFAVPLGDLRTTLAHHEDGVHAVAFSPDGRWLATGAKDGQALLYDAETLEPVQRLAHGARLSSLGFDRSARFLATCAEDGRVRRWEVVSGATAWIQDLGSPAGGLAFSPDGRELAVGTGDGRIVLLDFSTGAVLATLRGHTGSVAGIAFSPAENRLASVSEDGTVRIWDAAVRLEMLVLRGHESWVFGVAFSPDGARLATGGGSYDGTGVSVRIWNGALARR